MSDYAIPFNETILSQRREIEDHVKISQARITEKESALREIANKPMAGCGECCVMIQIARRALGEPSKEKTKP